MNDDNQKLKKSITRSSLVTALCAFSVVMTGGVALDCAANGAYDIATMNALAGLLNVYLAKLNAQHAIQGARQLYRNQNQR